MRITGLTGLYKKTYLEDDLFRFEFSRHVLGYLDDVTGDFTDEFGNIYSNVRDVSFLDSKDVEGHYGFLSFEEFYKFFPDFLDKNPDIFLHDYDERSKMNMLFVSIVNGGDDFASDTVLTEVDLNEIHKRGVKYYFDYVDSFGVLKHAVIYHNGYDLDTSKVRTLLSMGAYDMADLEKLLLVYEEPYEITCNIIDCCEIAFAEMRRKTYTSHLNDRNPKLEFKKPYNAKMAINLLEKRQLSKKEIKDVYKYFLSYRADLESLFDLIHEEEDLIRERMDEFVKEIDDNQEENIQDEVLSEYSLDDLKELRESVEEYLVGQSEPLRRLTSELSRMKDKNFEDNVGILLSGDSGVGKTFMVQLVAKFLDIPFVRVDSTDLTSPGYIGRDLEEVVYELYEVSGKDKEKAEHGIIFFDEIDKKGSERKDDVAGKAVLNHLLTLIDGSDIYAVKSTKSYGPQDEVKINSKHMVIIAAGSFPDVYKKKGGKTGFIQEEDDDYVNNPNKTPKTNVFVEKAMMTPDFMNRLPIRIRLNSLTEKDYENNFTKGKDSPLKWEEKSFAKHGVTLKTTNGFIKRASVLSLEEDSGFRGSKGIILTATAEALNDVITNKGKYSEITLTEETLDNPKVYIKK